MLIFIIYIPSTQGIRWNITQSGDILYILVLRVIKIRLFEPEVVIFPVCNTNIYKICELRRAILSTFYNISQHFATKLCNFTHSKLLFLALVLDFVRLAKIKI